MVNITSISAVRASTLRSAGYRVVEAADGLQAAELCRQHEGPLDLLVTDVVMPGLSGPQLATLASGLRPALKVLYLSGYPDDAIFRQGVGPGLTLLQKPFTRAALAAKVREVLDRKR